MRWSLFLLVVCGAAAGCSSARCVTLEVSAATVTPVVGQGQVTLKVER
jgi:hypothetical protein